MIKSLKNISLSFVLKYELPIIDIFYIYNSFNTDCVVFLSGNLSRSSRILVLLLLGHSTPSSLERTWFSYKTS